MKSANVVYVGNSIFAGNHVGAGEDIPSLVIGSIPSISGSTHNIAVPSSTCDGSGQGAAADALYNAAFDVNILIPEWGTNDMVSIDGPTFKGNLKTWCLARHAGFLILVFTTLPNGSYDNTPIGVSNGLIRSDSSFYTGRIDVGKGSGTVMGADSAPSNATLYNSGDLVHPTFLGNQLIEPYVSAAILALMVSGHMSNGFLSGMR